jgi:hypothetical protein
MEHGTTGDAVRHRMGRARGIERSDGSRAVRRGQDRADSAVISTVWKASSGRSDTLFQAF